MELDDSAREALMILTDGCMDGFPTAPAAAVAASAAAAAAAAAAASATRSADTAIRAFFDAWKPNSLDPTCVAVAQYVVKYGLPVYVAIETCICMLATILIDDTLRRETNIHVQEMQHGGCRAYSFDLTMGQRLYHGAMYPNSGVHHDPDDSFLKALPVPSPQNVRVYSMDRLGYIMLTV